MTREELEALSNQIGGALSIANELDAVARFQADLEQRVPGGVIPFLNKEGYWILQEDCLNKIKALVLDWLKSRQNQLNDDLKNFKL